MISGKSLQTFLNLIEDDRIINLNVLGRIKFNPEYDFILDGSDKGFIYRSGYWNTIYAMEDSIAEELLKNFKPEGEAGFSGVHEKYYHMAKKFHQIVWDELCHLFYLDPKEYIKPTLDHEVCSLSVQDADIVNEYYTYKEEGSLQYIQECIANRPSSVIRDAEGKPLSWALIREDGSMGVMYTLKEHRSKGYALSVSHDLASKAVNLGLTPFVHIVKGNTASVNLAKSIGFKHYCDVMWFGI